MSAIDSRLAVDFYPPSNVGTSQDHRQLRLQGLVRRGSGESFRLAPDCPQAVELVQASSWDVDEAMSMRDVARTFVAQDSGLPLEAVSEHKTLVCCRSHDVTDWPSPINGTALVSDLVASTQPTDLPARRTELRSSET